MAAWAENAWADGAWADDSWVGMGDEDAPESEPGGSSRRNRRRRMNRFYALLPFLLAFLELKW